MKARMKRGDNNSGDNGEGGCGEGGYGEGGYGEGGYGDDGNGGQVKNHQNFILHPPLQMYNLKPDDNGLMKCNIQGLDKFNILYVIACDGKSITQREVIIKDLFDGEADLNKEASHASVPKKNLTQQIEVPSE